MFKCDEGPTKENGTPYMFILLLFSLLFLGFEVTDTDINRDPLAHATLTYSVGGVPVRTTDADPDIKEGIAQVEKGGLVYYTADGIAARNTLIELGGKIYYADYDGFFRTGPVRKKGKLFYFSHDDCSAATGIYEFEGRKYYFDPSTERGVRTGRFIGNDGETYYADCDGLLLGGFQKEEGGTAYYDENYRRFKGRKLYIQKKTVTFDSNGYVIKQRGGQ